MVVAYQPMLFFTTFPEPFVWMVRFLMDPGCARCQGSEAKTWWSQLIFEHSKNLLDPCQKYWHFWKMSKLNHHSICNVCRLKENLAKEKSTFTFGNSVGSWFLTAKTSLPPIEIFNQNSPPTSSCTNCHFQLMQIFSQGGDLGSITMAIMCHFVEPSSVNLSQNVFVNCLWNLNAGPLAEMWTLLCDIGVEVVLTVHCRDHQHPVLTIQDQDGGGKGVVWKRGLS